ncbi:MAG: tRNA-binding protein [Candidatus Dormibacteria bacterium]
MVASLDIGAVSDESIPQVPAATFDGLEMRVGLVLEVDDFARARRPSYRLLIDFGPLGTRRSSAGLKAFYSPGELLGRRVVCVCNLPPRNIAGFMSEVLVLGATEADGRVRLLTPDSEASLGCRVT